MTPSPGRKKGRPESRQTVQDCVLFNRDSKPMYGALVQNGVEYRVQSTEIRDKRS